MAEVQPQSKEGIDTHFDLRSHRLTLEQIQLADATLFQARFLLRISHPEYGDFIKAASSDIEIHEVPTPQKNHSRIRFTKVGELNDTVHILHVGLDGSIRCAAPKVDTATRAETTILEGWLMPLVDSVEHAIADQPVDAKSTL